MNLFSIRTYYLHITLLFALCASHLVAFGQAIKVSNTTAENVSSSPSWPSGMVWQTLAFNDNGTLRYWQYTATEQPIALVDQRGTTDADLWAVVPERKSSGIQYYYIYNKEAGKEQLLVYPLMPRSKQLDGLDNEQSPCFIHQDQFSTRSLARFWALENGKRIHTISHADLHKLYLGILSQTTAPRHKLHYRAYEQSGQIVAQEVANSAANVYKDSVINALGALLPDIRTVVTDPTSELSRPWTAEARAELDQLRQAYEADPNSLEPAETLLNYYTQTSRTIKQVFAELTPLLSNLAVAINYPAKKQGVVGSWKPAALAQLKTLYNSYTSNPNFGTAERLLNHYKQSIENGDHIGIISHKVYRFVNAFEKLGSHSLAIVDTTNQITMKPTDANDLSQHFVLIKKHDGYYIGSPYTGKFMAIPKYENGYYPLRMRSLNKHFVYDRRPLEEYDSIGALVPYAKDAGIHQIQILNHFRLHASRYLLPSTHDNLGGYPIAFSGKFSGSSYDPDTTSHSSKIAGKEIAAGWYIYPVGDMPLSAEAYEDLVRAANIAAIAGETYAPTKAAAAALTSAYEEAISTIPPTPERLAKLHAEASSAKINAMPWVQPRANVPFQIQQHYQLKNGRIATFWIISVPTDRTTPPKWEENLGNTLPDEFNSFVFEPVGDGSSYLWVASHHAYACVRDNQLEFTQDKAERIALTVKPYYADSTRIGFTMQAPDGQYVTYTKNPANGAWKYSLSPTIGAELYKTSVWGYDTSTVNIAYIDALGYTTFASPDTVDVPTALTPMKVVSYDAASQTLNVVAANSSIVPANTGVILRGEPGLYLIDPSKAIATATADYTDNRLLPVLAPTRLSHVYALTGTAPSDAKFARTAANVLFPPKRAYLPSSALGGTTAPAIKFVVDATTAIGETTADKPQATDVYYDLQGRRVLQPSKGIYILNGKTIVL